MFSKRGHPGPFKSVLNKGHGGTWHIMNVGSQNALNEGPWGTQQMSSMRGPRHLEMPSMRGGAQGTHSHFTKYGGQNVINEGPKRNMEL